MSKVLSVKMRNDVFEETEKITQKLSIPRNAYINQAVSLYNRLQKRALLKKKLARESELVRENSMEFLEMFERFEDDLSDAA